MYAKELLKSSVVKQCLSCCKVRLEVCQNFRTAIPGKAMPPGPGGRGNSHRLDHVRCMLKDGVPEADIREALKKGGLTKGRVSQIMSESRKACSSSGGPPAELRHPPKPCRKRPASHDNELAAAAETGSSYGNVKQDHDQHHEEIPGSEPVDGLLVEKKSSGSTSPSPAAEHQRTYRFKIQQLDDNFKVKATSKGRNATIVPWRAQRSSTENAEGRSSSSASSRCHPRGKGLGGTTPNDDVNADEADSHVEGSERPSSSSWGKRLRYSPAAFDMESEDSQAKANLVATQTSKDRDGEDGPGRDESRAAPWSTSV